MLDNNLERSRIKKLYLGKMTGAEAELKTKFTSQTSYYNKLLASSFISYSTVQEKE